MGPDHLTWELIRLVDAWPEGGTGHLRMHDFPGVSDEPDLLRASDRLFLEAWSCGFQLQHEGDHSEDLLEK